MREGGVGAEARARCDRLLWRRNKRPSARRRTRPRHRAAPVILGCLAIGLWPKTLLITALSCLGESINDFHFQSVTLVSILAARRHRHGGTAKVSTAGTAASSGMPVATAEGRGGSEHGGTLGFWGPEYFDTFKD